MVVKMSSPGRSFGGVAEYCLHDPRMPGEAHHPESAERVEWTETRNLATSEGERAGRIMAATAEASPELKRLAGGVATGRKLEKPGRKGTSGSRGRSGARRGRGTTGAGRRGSGLWMGAGIREGAGGGSG